MHVCDRCASADNNLITIKLRNKQFELCRDCSDRVTEFIQDYKAPKGFAKFLGNFGE
jgi:uncharacterized protein YlaI